MKKILCMLMALLLLVPFGLAEEAGDANSEINTLFAEGSFIVQIDVPAGDEGWKAEEAGDGKVLKLYNAEVIEDTFVARYDAVGDGTVTVTVKHMKDAACDRLITWDVKVQDGAAKEVTGGSYTQSPEDAELTPYIAGDWQVNGETTMAGMRLFPNPNGGWGMQVSMAYPETRVLRANLAYDCEKDQLVYTQGTLYESEITSEPEPTLGKALSIDASGSLKLIQAEDGSVRIAWHDDQNPAYDAEFHRPEGGEIRVIAPMFDGLNLEDSVNPARFNRGKMKDGVISMVELYSVDLYDIVDVHQMAVGDYLAIGGKVVRVETLAREEKTGYLLINGGYEYENGYTLGSEEDTNGFMAVDYNDLRSYTRRAVMDLPLAENVTFTDSADIEAEPVKASGIEAVTKAIQESKRDDFDPENTEIRIVDGKIVEINRRYTP